MNAGNLLFSDLPKGNISEIIIERIKDALISGALKPGDKIPTEVEFSEKLGVGRNTVREAIKVLVAFGVLEIQRAEGTFVTKEFNSRLLDPIVYGLILADKSMYDLLGFKLTFLNATLFSAISSATPEDLDHIQVLCNEFAETVENDQSTLEQMYEKGEAFYRQLGAITKNPITEQLNEIVLKISKYSRMRAIENSIMINEKNLLPNCYQRIVDTLREGDRQKLGSLSDSVLADWKKLLL